MIFDGFGHFSREGEREGGTEREGKRKQYSDEWGSDKHECW